MAVQIKLPYTHLYDNIIICTTIPYQPYARAYKCAVSLSVFFGLKHKSWRSLPLVHISLSPPPFGFI